MRRLASSTLAILLLAAQSAAAQPTHRTDAIELRLAPLAAQRARAAGAQPAQARPVAQLGVAAIDALAASLGASGFEPVFRAEVAPLEPDALDLTAYHRVLLPAGTDVAQAVARFAALPEVLEAAPIALGLTTALPDDSLAHQTVWLFRDVMPRRDIRAPEAWAIERGDTSIVVGVIDTGVNGWHPDLGGRGERGNLYVNWAEKAGLPGVDDDGNGYIDDVSGWDFVITAVAGQGGEDIGVEDNDPSDWVGHGTFVAGLVGAIGGNGIGLAGVVPEARVMPLRIGWLASGNTPPNGTVDMSYAAAAIRYATRMGVHVVNCSFTSLTQPSLAAAITLAARAGVVIVSASGNSAGAPAYIGQREETIAVAATDSNDVLATFAQRGAWVDLVADGVGMVSTYFQRTASDSLGGRTPAYRANLNGTSFAAPQVAGAVALMQARRSHQGLPLLTPLGAHLRVRETTEDIRALNPSVSNYGSGRLDLERMLTAPSRSWVVRGTAPAAAAPVVIADNRGVTRIVQATQSGTPGARRLVWLDPATEDTVSSRALPGNLVGQIAAGDLLDGQGPLIAYAMTNGQLMAHTADGAPRPGFPVALGAGVLVQSGAIIADLEGDGPREIVVGASDGRVIAVRGDGSPVPGFPIETGAPGVPGLAAAELDAAAGAELVALDGAGQVHAFGADGAERSGWPVAASASVRAPVVQRTHAGPQVVVLETGLVRGFDAAGQLRFSNSFTGTPSSDPLLADVTGDGIAEIVFATGAPNQLVVLDTLGVAVAGRGFPLALSSNVSGAPVAWPLPGGRQAIAFAQVGVGFVAVDDSARVLPHFPKPSGAGVLATLAQMDGDDGTEIAAGTAFDSSLVVFDAGAATFDPTRRGWASARGNVARTGSDAYDPTPVRFDRIRPAPPQALEAFALTTTRIRVRWTASGDDSLTGRATRLEVRYALTPFGGLDFSTGTLVHSAPPGEPGTLDSVEVEGVPEGRVLFVSARMSDDVGYTSVPALQDTVRTPSIVPMAVTDLRLIGATDSTVMIAWTATGADSGTGPPAASIVAASESDLDDLSFDAAPVRVVAPPRADLGSTETLTLRTLTAGRRWSIALKVRAASGALSDLSNTIRVVTPIGGALGGRTGVALAARPQPSAGPFTLDWQGDVNLLDRADAGNELTIHDLSGRVVRRFALPRQAGGRQQWDGRDALGRAVPAGLYLARLRSGEATAQARVMLIR